MKEKQVRVPLGFFIKMFFIGLRRRPYDHVKAETWKKSFAFLPVIVLRDGRQEKIRFCFYETRTYQKNDEVDEIVSWVILENRIPGSCESYKETLYGISC